VIQKEEGFKKLLIRKTVRDAGRGGARPQEKRREKEKETKNQGKLG